MWVRLMLVHVQFWRVLPFLWISTSTVPNFCAHHPPSPGGVSKQSPTPRSCNLGLSSSAQPKFYLESPPSLMLFGLWCCAPTPHANSAAVIANLRGLPTWKVYARSNKNMHPCISKGVYQWRNQILASGVGRNGFPWFVLICSFRPDGPADILNLRLGCLGDSEPPHR